MCSDDDSGNQDMMDTDWTEAEDESPKRNAEVILKISDIIELLFTALLLTADHLSIKIWTLTSHHFVCDVILYFDNTLLLFAITFNCFYC